ncbi:MAG: amino acid adenylation domain-containing protein, partial [Hormoscilla sp.]
NARSNQLAHYLRANGICRQDIVAIYAHRSAALVWALLGVLKAGAAFIILDPAYPSSRLIDCLGIAAPRGWLQLTAAATQPGPELLEVINELPLRLELPADIMANVPELGDYETSDPAVTVGPDDLAYVAFTSGSTGKPKGIAGSHKPLSHFMGWHAQKFGLTEGDRFSMLSGLSHDPLLRDIFTPLCIGATLYIPSGEDIETPGQLAHWMKRQLLSVTHLTPAMGQLLSESESVILPELRYGFFGGDRLTPQDVARISKLAPEVTCVNFYGATETPQAMGYFICPKSSDQSLVGGPSIPIGRGIADVQLLVLNSQQQLAGIGEVGEVYVRTPYLAKGYIGAEEMTQERFIVNPLTKMAGDMLYRTGDLARYLPDGNIVFQGRADNQVKIRGFRIETGEIEAILAQHPAVAEAVAIAREDRPGNKRLVAYVVLHQEQKEAVTVDELRQLVKQKLPSYMVPSAFVLLETLPLTANGKVDKRALPAPERNLTSEAETFVAPEDELERQLVEIWQSVLGVDPIGVKDDFFELGGHSLLAVTLFSEIEKVTKQKLPLATLFQAPTIAELGKIIRTDGWSAPWSPLVAMQPNGSKPPFFCVHAVGGNVLSYRELAMNLGQDQPVYGLQAEGLDGQKQNLDRIQDIAANYTKAMRHLQPEGPYYLGGYSFGGMVAFEIAQQLYAQGQEVALLVLFDTREPSLRPTFKSWLSFHVKNLIELEPQEKLNYIKVKTGLGIEGNWDLIEALRQMYLRNTRRKPRRLYNPPEELIRPYEQIIESNRKAYSSYVPQPLPGRVTLIRAKMGSASVHADPEGGWGKVALKGVEVHEVPGDHISIFQQPKVQVLASTLKACIDKAAGEIT